MTRYIEYLWLLDILYRYYPKYHTSDLIVLAEDVWKWINHELPEDSSTIVYLKHYFGTPNKAMHTLWKELMLIAGPYLKIN
jgi:hypothetical protein